MTQLGEDIKIYYTFYLKYMIKSNAIHVVFEYAKY